METENKEKEILKETLELTKENNKMLHKVRGVQKRQAIFNALKWIVIIGIAFGSFYFLEPYVKNIQNFIKDSGASIDQLKNLGSVLPR